MRAPRAPRCHHKRVTAKSRGASAAVRGKQRKRDKKKNGARSPVAAANGGRRGERPKGPARWSGRARGDGHVVAAAAAGEATTATHSPQGPRGGLGGETPPSGAAICTCREGGPPPTHLG